MGLFYFITWFDLATWWPGFEEFISFLDFLTLVNVHLLACSVVYVRAHGVLDSFPTQNSYTIYPSHSQILAPLSTSIASALFCLFFNSTLNSFSNLLTCVLHSKFPSETNPSHCWRGLQVQRWTSLFHLFLRLTSF